MHKVEFSRIALRSDRFLVGMSAKMSIAKDATPKLWQSFMPRRADIQNKVGEEFYSVQNFSESDDFESFAPESVFEKWAAMEVADESCVPTDMQLFVLRGGHYAVFDHYGPPGEFPKTLDYIFSEWMPQSEWLLDGREHFEILRPGWSPIDPDAQEEVWIPVRRSERK